MSAPLLPSPLDYVGYRRFAFYPAITHPDPNEWLLGGSSHAEIQAVNAHTGREIWISRQYIGAVSETSSPVLLVGLTKALTFREGTVKPKVNCVIEMPVGAVPHTLQLSQSPLRSQPATVTEIRLEPSSDSALNRAMISTCVGAIVVALLAALVAAAGKF